MRKTVAMVTRIMFASSGVTVKFLITLSEVWYNNNLIIITVIQAAQ